MSSKLRLRRHTSGRSNFNVVCLEEQYLIGKYEGPLLRREHRDSKSKAERAQVARLVQKLTNNFDHLATTFTESDTTASGKVPSDQAKSILRSYEDNPGEGAVESLFRMLRVQPREALDYPSFLTYIQRNKGNVILGDRGKAGDDGFLTGAPWEQRGPVHYKYANAQVQDNTGGLLRNPPGTTNQELADTAVIKKVCDAMRRHRRRLEKLFRVVDREQSGHLSRAQFLKTLQQIGIGIDPALCSRAYELLVPDEAQGGRLPYESLIDRLDLDPFRMKIPLPTAGASLVAAEGGDEDGIIASEPLHRPPPDKVAYLRRRLAGLDTNALQTFKRNDTNYDGRLTLPQLQRSLKTICPDLTESDVVGLYHSALAEHGSDSFTYRDFVRIYTTESNPIDPQPSVMATRRAASARPAALPLSLQQPPHAYARPITSANPTRAESPTRTQTAHATSSSFLAPTPAAGAHPTASLNAWMPPQQAAATWKSGTARGAGGDGGAPPPFGTFGKNLTLPTWKTSVRATSGGGLIPLEERPDLNASSNSIFKLWATAEPLGKYGRAAFAPPPKDTRYITQPAEGTSQHDVDSNRFAPRDESIRQMQENDRMRKSLVAEARQDRMRRHQTELAERKARDQTAAEDAANARVDARRVQTRRFYERVSLYDRIIEGSGASSSAPFFATSR